MCRVREPGHLGLRLEKVKTHAEEGREGVSCRNAQGNSACTHIPKAFLGQSYCNHNHLWERSLLSVMNLRVSSKPEPIGQTFLVLQAAWVPARFHCKWTLRDLTCRRNLQSVVNVENSLLRDHLLPSIRGFTQERSPINVINAGKLSTRLQTSFSIRDIILEKSDRIIVYMAELWDWIY